MDQNEPNLQWVVFDLDDTLHAFRKASGEAMEAVYGYLYEEFGIRLNDQRTAYKDILAQGQANHFTIDQPANDYRAERFKALLTTFNVLPHIHLDMMLEIYDRALALTLEPKDGAADLLRKLKGAGLSVMVVSEGPHDAQATTLERLGLSAYVDLLVTSSQEGVCKTDGLFAKAIDKAGCSPDNMILVGDNPERDILPAQALGIRSILLADQKPAEPIAWISTLRTLEANLDTFLATASKVSPARLDLVS